MTHSVTGSLHLPDGNVAIHSFASDWEQGVSSVDALLTGLVRFRGGGEGYDGLRRIGMRRERQKLHDL